MKKNKSESEQKTYNEYLKWRKNSGVENVKSKSELNSSSKKNKDYE